MIHHIIVYGEVPPNKRFPLDLFIDPIHIFRLDVADDRVARPHDGNVLVEFFSQSAQITPIGISPTLVIFCRAHDEGLDILLGMDEMVVDIIQ